ncbi:MAG: HIT family hydrolase [Acidobacteria bacterium]|nr:MAG: HIT family hydrolase [Acidobacteriota bacterium]
MVERLWSPWRHDYIAKAADDTPHSCVFCEAQKNPADDEQHFILHRGRHNFIILNLYPYISGHLMIAPYAHVGELDSAPKESTDEMMDLIKLSQAALREAYHPDGLNIGMNLGRAAGAGVADHIHAHIMPRWTGDTNFMTTIGETRVLSEDLSTTYQKLRDRF